VLVKDQERLRARDHEEAQAGAMSRSKTLVNIQLVAISDDRYSLSWLEWAGERWRPVTVVLSVDDAGSALVDEQFLLKLIGRHGERVVTDE
jgi:hypothetical protein